VPGAEVDSTRAWRSVAATFVSSAVTLGIAYSFSAFFQAMATEFGTTSGRTAVLFAVTTCTFFFLGLLTGRAVDRFGPRPLLLVAAVSLLGGLVATSAVGSLTVGYVTYGAGVGIAAACGYVPMVAVVGGWFVRRRAAAVGLAVAGIGVGTLVASPLSARLIEAYGWRDTYRILGVGGAVLLLGCTLLIERPQAGSGSNRPRFTDAIASPVFRRLHLSACAFTIALFVPFVFVTQDAKAQGVPAVQAALLVGLLGGASVIARVVFGSLTTRVGSFRLYRMCLAGHGFTFVLWLVAGSSFSLRILFVVLLGIGYGGFVALSPVVLADRLGVEGLGSILGLFYTASGVGGLLGPPIAGIVIDATGTYRWAIVACVVFGIASRGLLVGLPTTPAGRLEPEPSRTA